MKSICLFSSYFEKETIPYYIEVYLKELKNHFDELVLITNEKKLDIKAQIFLNSNKIDLLTVKNEGYDFGMWSKAFDIYPIKTYDQVALVNDSCILFSPLTDFFKWVNSEPADYCGFTESKAIAPHIQSYFLVLNKRAVEQAQGYFKEHGIKSNIQQVIEKYEVDFSSFLLSKGLKIASFLTNLNYSGEFSPYYYLVQSHIQQGSPLIKKKIVYMSYRKDELFTLIRMNFKIQPDYYIELIKAANSQNLIIDLSRLKSDYRPAMNFFQIAIYDLKRIIFHLLKRILKK